MNFNPDSSKKVEEVTFSRKVNNVLDPPLTFNNVDVGQIKSVRKSFSKSKQMYCYTSQT